MMLKLIIALLPYEWVGTFITGIRFVLIKVLKSDERKVQTLIDRINQELIKDDRYNLFVIENPELLDIRINSVVDDAIQEYLDLTEDENKSMIELPTYSEETDGETLLGGEMRLTAPYLKRPNNEL